MAIRCSATHTAALLAPRSLPRGERCAMLQRKSSAAQEQFAAFIQAFKANWVMHPMAPEAIVGGTPKALVVQILVPLERMASDPQMQPVWAFLSQHSDEVNQRFVTGVVWSAVWGQATPTARRRIHAMIRDV